MMDYPWKVQLKGSFDTDSRGYELSVIHKDDHHGASSWGWGGCSKIILFSSGALGNPCNGQYEFAMRCAELLCDALNKEQK